MRKLELTARSVLFYRRTTRINKLIQTFKTTVRTSFKTTFNVAWQQAAFQLKAPLHFFSRNVQDKATTTNF